MEHSKRTDRLRIPEQVNMDPELGSEIRAGAAREDRPVGLHIVVLLKEAVVARRSRVVHERRGAGAHSYAPARTDAPFGAPPHKASQQIPDKKDGTNS